LVNKSFARAVSRTKHKKKKLFWKEYSEL
jgi:hypothetical protein